MVPPTLTKASLIVPEASTITPILAPIPVFNEISGFLILLSILDTPKPTPPDLINKLEI